MRAALMIAAVLAASTAAPAVLAQQNTAFDPAATTFTGWVRVSRGEFQIYPEQRQLNQPFSRPCVSAALPRNAQEAAGDLNGSQIRFTGRAVRWDENRVSGTVRHEGSRIVNECGGEYVVLATDITVLR